MSIPENSKLCEHIVSGAYPFRVELVMDDHLGLTDGIASCQHCECVYLLEMLDWVGDDRLFRISPLAPDHARRLIRNLQRGSCDLQRAGAEVQHLKTASAFAPRLILVDTTQPLIGCVAPLPGDRALPGISWRDLPCDGTWVQLVRDYQATGSHRSSTAIVKG